MLVLAARPAPALDVPALSARVMDRAGLLQPATRDSLEHSLEAFEARTGHQIVVHITPSLEGLPIEDYSMQVAEAWKIGQRKLDNGVIFTIAPNERKMRIEVGYGLEGILPDAIAARIIRERVAPQFQAGNFDEGVVDGVHAIEDVTEGEQLPLPARNTSQGRHQLAVTLFWIAVIAILVLSRLPVLFGPAMASRRYGRTGGWGGGPWLGGGGFGGGGGFSGGGGGFGGGGASGGW
ncbi:MAG TPA: YgcG family protein [Myxococcota bacterium]|nr:YgcG family protein [Myxococcota bacterium]